MMLTDREWLRFVTFGLVAGAILGAVYTGALLVMGRSLVTAMAGAVVGCGLLALTIHLVMRYLLDAASVPPAEEAAPPETETEAEA